MTTVTGPAGLTRRQLLSRATAAGATLVVGAGFLAAAHAARAAEAGIEAAIREGRGRRWRDENREGIKAHNERIAREGPLLGTPWWAQPDEPNEPGQD